MFSVLLFAEESGRVVLAREYKGDVGSVRVAAFLEAKLRSGSSALARGDAPPLALFDGSTFVCRRLRRGGGAWLVGATSANVNAAAAVAFLAAFERVLAAYFADEPPTPAALRGKAALVFALLDEVMDFGVPQVLELSALRQYIFSKGAVSSASRRSKAAPAAAVSLAVTGAAPWRPAGVRYARNQVFLDVIERVDCTLSASGALLTGEVRGAVTVRAELSGMPTCVLALNDALGGPSGPGGTEGEGDLTPGAPERYAAAAARAELPSSFALHGCARLQRGDGEQGATEVAFVPPDGTFELLTYRAAGTELRPPLRLVSSVLQHGRGRAELVLLLTAAALPAGAVASDVRVHVLLPRATAALAARAGGAPRSRTKWRPGDEALTWKIPELPARAEATLNLALDLLPPTLHSATAQQQQQPPRWAAPPAQLSFAVAGHTATGLRVRYLRVQEKANYDTTKWIRYALQSGVYEARMQS